MADGRAVAGVAGEEGGVGAVEGGDDLGPLAGGQHGAGEKRGGGMRHGVVDMKHVERVVAADLGHLDRERERVVGIFEEVVAVDDDGMEEHARVARRHPERPFVADEMDFMAAPRQLLAQLGGEDAAATDGRVACDADLEGGRGHERLPFNANAPGGQGAKRRPHGCGSA